MPVKPSSGLTFHQAARRDQLVDLAIELIGEGGLAAATTSAIARRAGVSRGVVNYNVGGREELMDLVVARAYSRGHRAVRPAVDAAESPTAALRAFVVASLRFYEEQPDAMRALREIFADSGLVDRAVSQGHQDEIRDLDDLLVEGQRRREVVDGDTGLLAALLRAALDHAAGRIAAGNDAAALRDELLVAVDRALGLR